MSRLPNPGNDNGTWGNILNDFLGISHAQDGTLNSNTVGSGQIQSGVVGTQHLTTSVQQTLNAAVRMVNSKTPVNGAVTLAAQSGTIQTTSVAANSTVRLITDGTNWYAA